jgi:hypothetical protein
MHHNAHILAKACGIVNNNLPAGVMAATACLAGNLSASFRLAYRKFW